MLDRTEIVDKNFITRIREHKLPQPKSRTNLSQAALLPHDLLELFESQILSRHLDLKSRALKQSNLSFYTIGSSGHEGNAAIARAFAVHDPAFLHYRSGAFMLERARFKPELNIVYEMMLGFVASSEDPVCAGRHKICGHYALNVPPQTSTIASHLPKAVGCALAVGRARALHMPTVFAEDSAVLCSFGDASLNHSSARGAINAAQWIAHKAYPMPIVFICEDNGIGISVPTPSDWVEMQMQHACGLHYLQADGLNLCDVYYWAKQAESIARGKRKPVFLHMKTVRLLGHAGSDIETQYLSGEQIEQNEWDDPLLHSARILLEHNILSGEEILACYEAARKKVNEEALKAVARPRLANKTAVLQSLLPKPNSRNTPTIPDQQQRKLAFKEVFSQLDQKRNMSQLINFALTDLMLQFSSIVVFGEDVAIKGGVYRVTADLLKRFGRGRVFDTLLDEQTILGTAIGLSMNGFIPIPEIQFLAYFHNACDQIRGEAATLSFFSNGLYSNPMIVRVPGLAYQKGFGGHFHNDNTIAVFRDIPGVIVVCPSNGLDAVKLLRSCAELAFKERRIIIFIEPIALYMTRDLHENGDCLWNFSYPNPQEQIAFGEIGVLGEGMDLAIISYGNGYYLSCQAEKILKTQHDLQIKLIDLRWLNPLNKQSILEASKNCQAILIVDECRNSGSLSEALMTMYVESGRPLPKLKRITGDDCFIPLGTAWQYVLPSKDDIIHAALSLVGEKSCQPPRADDGQQRADFAER